MKTINYAQKHPQPGITSLLPCAFMAIGLLLLTSCLTSLQPATTQPRMNSTPFAKSTANGITVTARNVRIKSPYLEVDVCFDRPTDADWNIEEAYLQFESRQISLTDVGSLCLYSQPCEGLRTRCDTLGFPLVKPGLDLTSSIEYFTITINEIIVIPQNDEICNQPFLDRFQRELASRNPGITASSECDEFGYQFLVTSKPSEIAMEQAQAIVWEVFQEVVGSRKGPWILEGRVE